MTDCLVLLSLNGILCGVAGTVDDIDTSVTPKHTIYRDIAWLILELH